MKFSLGFILSLVMLCFSTRGAHAFEIIDFEQDLLIQGPGEYWFDVEASENSVVVLELGGRFKGSQLTAKVMAEYGDFVCEVINIGKANSDHHIVHIMWEPGADLSGCYLEITHPLVAEKAKIHLFMNY
jgi:hypothetical protein